MLKIFLNALLMFLSISLLAQNTSYFEAEYNIYYNTDVPQIRKGLLQVDIKNKDILFHISKDKNILESNSGVTTDDYGVTYKIKHKDIETFIEINFNSRTAYSKENHKGKTYYIKDKVPNFIWNLKYSETKKIGTLLCKKATTYFRGRNYTAWYAIEIPINYGPYKFQGLPGLIASISDNTGTFIWTLASYKAKNKKPEFKNKNKLKPIISAKKYFTEIRYPSGNERLNIIQSKLPKGIKLISATSDVHIRKGIETEFEWEEKTKKSKS